MAISHAFSNQIADGTNTNIVRPSDWNSAHNQYYTLSGNTLGASTVSGTNVVFQGSGNVSLSGTGSTIIVYGTGGGGGGVALGASSQTATSGTVNFVNSNGVSFGMSGSSQITASHNGITTQTVQTQASGNIAGTGFSSTTTAGTAITAALGTNGLTMAIPAYLTAAVGGGGVAIGASSQTATSGTVNFVNSNGITFGMSGSTRITASYTVPTVPTSYVSNVNGSSGQISLNVGSSLSSSTAGSSITFGLASNITTALQSAGNYLTTARASNDAVGLNTAGTNVTWTVNSSGISLNAGGYAGTNTSANNASVTLNSNGLTISVAAPGGGGIAAAAGTQTATSGTIVFSNSNGITFGMSGSTRITASHNGITTQTVQTQASGAIAGTGFTTATTAGTVITGALGTNGLNLGVPAYLTTQSVQTQAAGNIAGTGFSSTTTAGTAITAALGTNGLTMAIPAYLTAAAGGGGIALGASTQTATSGTVNFVNSNGISFGMSGSNQITASHNGITSQSVQTQASGNIARTGFTSATTAGTAIVGTLNTAGLNLGVPAYLTTQSVQTQAVGNIAGTGFSSTTTAGTAITAALGTNGLNLGIPAYLTAAAGAGNAIGVTGGGSTGVAAAGTVYFGTANQLTFGFDPVSTRVTAAWGLIVTAGTTNANPVRQLSFSDVNGISFGLSTGAGAGHTITASVATSLTNVNISAGTTSNNLSNFVFSNSNGVSFGLNGSTVTASVAAAGGVIQSGYSPHGDYPLVTGLIGQGTLALDPDIFPDLTLNMVAMPINFSFATNSTGSFTISNWLGLYSRNVSSISLAHSTSFTAAITFSGIANSASYNGWRNITYNWSTSVSGGRYWIANIMRTTTGGANCSFSQYLASQINTNFSGAFGVASNATAQLTLGQGFYSASTTALPGSIAFTEIRGSNSLAQRFPMVAFGYNTV